jgi:hypothetical protein
MNATKRNPARRHQALVPVPVAADLAGFPVATVEMWLAEGSIYSERIRNNVFVGLDDVTALASEAALGRGGQQ